MAIPVYEGTNKTVETQVPLKCLQLIQQVIKVLPGLFNKEQIQTFISLIHFPHHQIKEEIANLLMIVSPSFDDETSLMEVQKFSARKQEEEQDIIINFNEEPNKSQKQIMKIIKTMSLVQTRSKFLEGLSADAIESLKEGEESLNTEPSRDTEEKASLIFQCFNRKTSVIYDI
jgi:hypothetical protein